ncbi:MAG: hypothetical protein F6K14_26575 [Symploca sp. SIO2C1]|nr:hypothetical protein [Symploca sp. SIO2C1]
MPVTNYDLIIEKSYEPGELVTLDDAQIWTFTNGTGVILPFGLGVVAGTGEGATGKVILPADANGKFEGITYRTNTFEKRSGYTLDDATGWVGYPKDREVSICRRALGIAVLIDSDVSRGSPVFLRHTATPGTTGIAGCFRKDADTANAIAIPNATFLKAAPAPVAGEMGVGILELRMI